MRKLIFTTAALFFLLMNMGAQAKGTFYQLTVYHYKTAGQFAALNNYFEKAYLPGLHRLGIKQVGVFSTLETDTADRRMYVLLPIKNLEEVEAINTRLAADKQYLSDAAAFTNAVYNQAPYTRMEVILLSAFPKMLQPAVPKLTAPKAERIYELRSYESPTQSYHQNKVNMFNDGDEVGIFKRLNFNAVFYAHVIAGSHMPNLMYLTTFNNMADREEHWKAFSSDAAWKTLSAKKEYQNNVSHADIIFLRPAGYSDF